MPPHHNHSPIDDRDGPWGIGDWIWAGVCWVALILCYAAVVYALFESGKPVQ